MLLQVYIPLTLETSYIIYNTYFVILRTTISFPKGLACACPVSPVRLFLYAGHTHAAFQKIKGLNMNVLISWCSLCEKNFSWDMWVKLLELLCIMIITMHYDYYETALMINSLRQKKIQNLKKSLIFGVAKCATHFIRTIYHINNLHTNIFKVATSSNFSFTNCRLTSVTAK